MKFVLPTLRVGDRVVGKIEEVLAGDDLLINFHGDLLCVHNESRQPFTAGDRIELIVGSIEPLVFKLPPPRNERRGKGLDVSI